MPDNISAYLLNDPYRPLVPKSSLQQYDNYRIYDLVCVDEVKTTYSAGSVVNVTSKKQQDFLAIQAYSVIPILPDFVAIVNAYP